jgi:Ca2+:H+ antiporter
MADSDSSASSISSIHSGSSPFRRFRRWSRHSASSRHEEEVEQSSNAVDVEAQAQAHGTQQNEASAPSGGDYKEKRSVFPTETAGHRKTLAEIKANAEHAGLAEKQDPAMVPYGENPKVKFWFAGAMLLCMTTLAGITAEWLIESIDGLTATGNVSREFVGLILLPVIGMSPTRLSPPLSPYPRRGDQRLGCCENAR